MFSTSHETFPDQATRLDEQASVLFEQLMPILFVEDLDAERDFYVHLGFTIIAQEPAFPHLITLAHGSITFGLEYGTSFTVEHPNKVLTWRFGVKDQEAVKQRLAQMHVRFREEEVVTRQGSKYRVLHVRTPNGYHLFLEEVGVPPTEVLLANAE